MGNSVNALVFCMLPLTLAAQSISFLPPQNVANSGAHIVAGCSGCVAVADFNSDGWPDIAFNMQLPDPEGGVLLGNGDGTFRPALPLPYPALGPLLAGDFNGDGKPDLVFADCRWPVIRTLLPAWTPRPPASPKAGTLEQCSPPQAFPNRIGYISVKFTSTSA